MSKTTEQGPKTLTLSKKLDTKKVVESDQVRQSFSHGRSKTVSVEVKRKRVTLPGEVVEEKPAETPPPQATQQPPVEPPKAATTSAGKGLTEDELINRLKVVQEALKAGAMETEERLRREAEEAEWRRQMEELAQNRQREEPAPQRTKAIRSTTRRPSY